MNVLAQSKRRPLSLVGASIPRSSNDVFDYSPTSLDRSFEGWLKAVAEIEEATQDVSSLAQSQDSSAVEPIFKVRSLELCPPVANKTQLRVVARPPVRHTLTSQDFIQVMMVTLREGFKHRRWPMDAVTKFLAAEVIAGGVEISRKAEAEGEGSWATA